MEIKQDVFEEFNKRLDSELANMIWMDPRPKSYMRNKFGRVATQGAWKTVDYWQWTLAPKVDEYNWR
jgi:4-hydroxyacetophenone monooxygenase